MPGDELLRGLDERDKHVYGVIASSPRPLRRVEIDRRLGGPWSMASDTLTRHLRTLQGEGLVHQAPHHGKYELGASARFRDLQIYGWARKTVEELQPWGGLLEDEDIKTLMGATQLMKQLDDRYGPHPLLEILNKMPVSRTADPRAVKAQGKGNVGASPLLLDPWGPALSVLFRWLEEG